MTETELPDWAARVAVFDTETTGVDVRTVRIVSACVALLDEHGDVIERTDWLADPDCEIPWQAQRVHGISTAKARSEGRPEAEVVAELVTRLGSLFAAGVPVVAYNAPYDFTILQNEATRLGIAPLVNPSPIIDPLIIDKAVDTYRKGKRTLTAACAHYAVKLESAHDAGADAIAAGRLAQALASQWPELRVPAQELHTNEILWAKDQAESFTDYMRNVRGLADFYASGAWPIR